MSFDPTNPNDPNNPHNRLRRGSNVQATFRSGETVRGMTEHHVPIDEENFEMDEGRKRQQGFGTYGADGRMKNGRHSDR